MGIGPLGAGNATFGELMCGPQNSKARGDGKYVCKTHRFSESLAASGPLRYHSPSFQL